MPTGDELKELFSSHVLELCIVYLLWSMRHALWDIADVLRRIETQSKTVD
jgi:hypothetical protein